MTRGFTLIELLAVIVILAIIALIAVPIVLNIINDSKESSLLRSAEFYLDAVEYTIADAFLYHGGLTDGEYPITPTGDICKENETPCSESNTLKVDVNGEKPTGGTITIKSGDISDLSLILDEKTIIKNSDGELVYSICTLISGDKNTLGSKYECEVSPGIKHNFYVLSSGNNGTTNLIMERNICSDGIVATEDNTCTVAWNLSGSNLNGPLDAMNYLNQATNSWSNIENLNITYNDEGGHFTNIIITGKARMPYLSEVETFDVSKNNAYLYEYLDSYWDHDPETKPKNSINAIYGYWTLSSTSNTTNAMIVAWDGYVDGSGNVENNDNYGVRPVINLKL